jgi:hypothetical protein
LCAERCERLDVRVHALAFKFRQHALALEALPAKPRVADDRRELRQAVLAKPLEEVWTWQAAVAGLPRILESHGRVR